MMTWLCQLSGRYFVMLDFYINQDYITKNLCVDRNKPKMHCNGKEEDKKEQESPERNTDKNGTTRKHQNLLWPAS